MCDEDGYSGYDPWQHLGHTAHGQLGRHADNWPGPAECSACTVGCWVPAHLNMG